LHCSATSVSVFCLSRPSRRPRPPLFPYTTLFRSKTKRFYGVSPRAWQGAVGGEITWKITPQLVTVFTANTDFAETEVDTRQINRSEEHTSELQSLAYLVCRLLLEKKKSEARQRST